MKCLGKCTGFGFETTKFATYQKTDIKPRTEKSINYTKDIERVRSLTKGSTMFEIAGKETKRGKEKD
jgi:hypothetical protein